MSLPESRTVSVTIRRPVTDVYAFAALPENFPRWASGLGSDLRQDGRNWRAQGPDGPVQVRFSPKNEFGVLDHWVTPDNGEEIYIPLRVIEHGVASEVMLTLLRQPGISDDAFARDVNWVKRDLIALRELLEGETRRRSA